MQKKSKILFVSGSPRNGNTNFILEKVIEKLDNQSTELILLKDHVINPCKGCMYCHSKPKCTIKDEFEPILKQVIESDILVLATPNYFDNVSGLMKNFIDRCHPLYKGELIKNKKVILIFVGGGSSRRSKKYLKAGFFGFVDYLLVDLVDVFSFQAQEINELKNKKSFKGIESIVAKLNQL